MAALATFAWFGTSDNEQAWSDMATQRLPAVQAAAAIRFEDEVLTNAVTQYLVTDGEIEWRDRYVDHARLLDEALVIARSTAPSAALVALEAVDDSNDALVDLEAAAFEAVDAGESVTAAKLLQGEYQTLKDAYRVGVDNFVVAVQDDVARVARNEKAATAQKRRVILVASLLLAVLLAWLSLREHTQRRALAVREIERALQASQREYEQRLDRALEMARTESNALEVARAVLGAELSDYSSEILLADSSRAHLIRKIATHPEDVRGSCDVASPVDCPAVRRSATMIWSSSTDYETCPHLRSRGVDCSAMCVPIPVAGQARGVVHCVTEPDTAPGAETRHVVEQLAARAGDRIGVLRAFARSQLQAETDPLTALLNRRSLTQQASDLWATHRTISVAFGDLDNFKQLNDTHGHEAGDRALRLFARALKESVRDADLVGRWGGEEFLVVFPGLNVGAGAVALERVRATLATRLGQATVPPFTVSFGIVDSSQFAVFDDLVAAADEAMLIAKQQGRNRVVAGEGAWTDSLDARGDAGDDAGAPSSDTRRHERPLAGPSRLPPQPAAQNYAGTDAAKN